MPEESDDQPFGSHKKEIATAVLGGRLFWLCFSPLPRLLVNSSRAPHVLAITGNQTNDRRWCLRARLCSRLHMGAPVMKIIAACAVVIFLGLATHATAAEVVEKQWSALFPDHTAIPEKFGTPIRERFSESDTMRAPGVQVPVPAPSHKVAPSLAEPKE
jgi:hypothetical protein